MSHKHWKLVEEEEPAHGRCSSCGKCACCGRGDVITYQYPYYPYITYPTYPYTVYSSGASGGNVLTSGNTTVIG